MSYTVSEESYLQLRAQLQQAEAERDTARAQSGGWQRSSETSARNFAALQAKVARAVQELELFNRSLRPTHAERIIASALEALT